MKTSAMQPSPISLTSLNGSEQSLNSFDQNLPAMPDLITDTSQSQPQSQPSSQSQNPSQKNDTRGSGLSANARKKLTAEEVKFEKLHQDLFENISSIAGVLIVVGHTRKNDPLKADGMVIAQHADKLSTDLSALARKYEYVYNALNTLVQATVWGAVIGDVAAITLGIAANHGFSVPGMDMQQQPAA